MVKMNGVFHTPPLTASSLLQRPVLGRRHALTLFEGAAEHALTGKAGVEADVLHGKPGIFQEISGGGEAGVDQIFMRGEAGLLFKGTDEMILA